MAIERQDIHAHLEVYLGRLHRLIAQYRAGQLSEAETIPLHSQYSTDLTVAMTNTFVPLLLEDGRAAAAAAAAPAGPVEAYPMAYVHPARLPITNPGSEPSSSPGPNIAPADPPADPPAGE